LWNVDDYSTRLLMEQFYKNLAKGTLQSPATKAEAMRDAQLMLLRGEDTPLDATETSDRDRENSSSTAQNSSLRHPFYWAPFILMGRSLG